MPTAPPPRTHPASSSSSARPQSPLASVPPPLLKLTILGPTSTGKTALRHRFLTHHLGRDEGRFSDRYMATIGSDFVTRRVEVPFERWTPEHDDGEQAGKELVEVDLQVWDTAGQERFKSLSLPFFRSSLALILCFSYTTPLSETLPSLKSWYELFVERCPVDRDDPEWFCWVLVGCKADLVDDEACREVERAVLDQVSQWTRAAQGRRRDDRGVETRDFEREGGGVARKVEVLIGDESSQRRKTSTRRRAARDPVAIDSKGQGRGERTSRDESGELDDDEPSRSHGSNSTVIPGTAGDGRPSSPRPVPPRTNSTASNESATTTTTTVSVDSLPPHARARAASSRSALAKNLVLATSPPHPPPSVEPLGHPKAVYEGGPFAIHGRLLEGDQFGSDEDGREGDESRTGDTGADRSGRTDEGGGEARDEANGTRRREPGERFERHGFKFFRTSAKTGLGVEEVFTYAARRILYNLSHDEQLIESDRALEDRKKGDGVIRVNERETGGGFGAKLRRACCS
ncbi:hypothetical protein JCM10212_001077 [Sporobolomyces blumeae]